MAAISCQKYRLPLGWRIHCTKKYSAAPGKNACKKEGLARALSANSAASTSHLAQTARYPAALRRKWSNVFRISATLSEPVDREILRAALQVGDSLETKGAGELSFATRNVAHTLANHSDAPARYVLVCAPAGFERHWARITAESAKVQPGESWVSERT